MTLSGDGLKAVVLARGLGNRMRDAAVHDATLTDAQQAAAESGLKSMMPMAQGASSQSAEASSRPFLDYVISSLADAGCRQVALVIGPEHVQVRQYYGQDAPPRRVRLEFLEQTAARGTADAVLAAETWVASDPFLVLNADNLYPVEALRALAALDGPGLPVFERDDLVRSSNIPPERVAAFALVDVDDRDRLVRIVEKPGIEAMAAAGPRALVSMNVWRFDREIFGPCRDVPRSTRGEFELPGAVALALTRGMRLTAVRAQGAVLDLSRRSDVAEVARRLAHTEPRP